MPQIQSVEPRLLIEANNAVVELRRTGEPAIAMIAHFDGQIEPDVLVAINYRLMALAKIIQGTNKSPWVIDPKGKKYKLVSETMFRAAAITPLSVEEDQPVGNVAFDPALFIENALCESDVSGNA